MSELVVQSDVGRDLLQSAEHFKTDRAVVWEYVANSLQYANPSVPPEIMVTINEKKKSITISDNGSGMNKADLQHFFTMHGENRERAKGRIGRGMFGTGKSAAFGIASILEVSSVKDGIKTSVRLTREQVESVRHGQHIRPDVLENEVPTGENNGTVVEISQIHLRRIDRAAIIGNIERHLAHYPRDVEVFVDHHECKFKEPEIAEEYEFTPPPDVAGIIGDTWLRVKVARGPLDEELRGVQIYSHRNWHATTLAGSENKKMSEFILGEVDVPKLEEYEGPIRPFDNTRSGQLNPENEVVSTLYRFIGPKIDQVRRQLVNRERERAKSEEAQRLAQQANKIAEILSEDFASFQAKLRRAQSVTTGRDLGTRYAPTADEDEGPWVEGGPHLADPLDSNSNRGTNEEDEPGTTGQAPELPTPVQPNEEGKTTGKPRGGSGKSRRPSGGLHVEHQNMGEEGPRGRYMTDHRTIIINLDHPEVAAAYKLGGLDDPAFERLTWEVAVTEYAVALAGELVEQYIAPEEALYDIRDTIDRVSRRLTNLYAA
jgi:anti-sigma regulatory factor (Ser/Thr protein kinase)